ncbi:hypothetical protein ABT083_07025 [Streptomyces goshikiensis]|uniref:hypothetical protein n=1 Tax=Streptomyces goshikiensis TaxID=1942 RepID=UPI00332BE30E
MTDLSTAFDAVTTFLDHDEQRRFAYSTRRLRGGFLTECLEHAVNVKGGSADLTAAELMKLPCAIVS